MKLTVLVPSEEYRSQAGTRIRYNRIASHLARQGIDLAIEDIGGFDPNRPDVDAVLISKCHDPRSLVAAAVVSRRGKLVGIDLFDDYFSETSDTRLLRYRAWLSQVMPSCDFALCSTDAMREIVRQYRPGLPAHVMNDPAPDETLESVPSAVARKVASARNHQRIRVGWFGLGDNRFFRIGLADLSAFGAELSKLRHSGMDVELTILTNARALTAEGLSMIGQLPVRSEIREWSEAEERDLLDEALVAFLPVNAQPFSMAKSLNRAVTALSSGCQVLSVGYPLYEALEPLIYRDADEFLADLSRGSLRLSSATMDEYRGKVEAFASAEAEARRVAAFFKNLNPREGAQLPLLSLIHGHSTRAEAHKLVQEARGLSIASPYCSAPFDFDVVFRAEPNGAEMLVSPEASGRLLPHARARLKGTERIRGKLFHCLASESARRRRTPETVLQSPPISFQLATYANTMREIESRIAAYFGPSTMILSETSPLPFSTEMCAD